MPTVTRCELPETSLLHRLAAAGAFVDCYAADVPGHVTQAELVAAFYTSPLFKAERLVLRLLASSPSTDQEASDLAQGRRERFAVWTVQARAADQVLLADETGRTRSWLMTLPLADGAGEPATRLFFGSALLPRTGRRPGAKRFGPLFGMLIGLHGAYSRALLRAAAVPLARRAGR